MDYIVVHIEVKPFTEERAEIVLAEVEELGFESFSIEEPYLHAYIPKEEFSESALKALLSAYVTGEFTVSYTIELIMEQNWNALWESNFEPIVIDGLCTVKASHHKNLPPTKYTITIDPKMSFGTGHHQTTYLMMEGLLGLGDTIQGLQVLDMGCGTGILAILAAKMGAKAPVHAIDVDHICFYSAKENAYENGVGEMIHVLCGDASLLQASKYDLILANINRNILLEDMKTYARSLRPGGELFISGFYIEDIPILMEEASKYSLEIISSRERDRWSMVRLRALIRRNN